MKVSVKFSYGEMVTPYRCRKPRLQECYARDKKFTIRETYKEYAPIAFRVHNYKAEVQEVRLYRGQLYKRYQARNATNTKQVNVSLSEVNFQFLLYVLRWNCMAYTKDQHLKAIRKECSKYLIIDNKLYKKCSEPYYFVVTFGLGHNHGGTGFFVKYAEPRQKKVYGWSANEHDKAIEEAVQIALKRGDTKSESYIRNGGNGSIDVLIPSAVKKTYYMD